MANKSTSTSSRNTDRRSGKKWGKDHTAEVKALTPEQQANKANKQKERQARLDARRANRGSQSGPSVTMPKISWEWATEMMVKRWPNTRKVRAMNEVLANEGRRGQDDFSTTVVETSPETKPVKSKRKGR